MSQQFTPGDASNLAIIHKALIQNIPTKPWPIWAKALKKLATPEDKGIGDVVARLIGTETSDAFKAWHLVTFGKPCGCTGRQAKWNLMFPL